MRLLTAFLLVSLFLAIGCKTDDDVTPLRERSFLHILGASAPSDTFNITFDFYNADDIVISDFYYKRNWPIMGYADMLAAGLPDEHGNGKLYITATQNNIINAIPDTIYAPEEIVLEAGEKSTIVFADSLGEMKMRKYPDVYDNANGGNIRFLNLDASVVSASLSATNGAFSINSVPFLGDGNFVTVPGGTYDIEVRDDDTGNVIASITGYTISSWGAFTFYLGQAGGGELDVFRH